MFSDLHNHGCAKVAAPVCRLAVAKPNLYLGPVVRPVDVPASPIEARPRRNPIHRALYFLAGLACLALIPLSFLPGIPTFDLVLLAAFFFSKSSERVHSWMLNHPYFGKIIKGYRRHGLTVRMKWAATIAIVLSLGVSAVFLTDNIWIRLILTSVGVYAVWFVFTRPARSPGDAV